MGDSSLEAQVELTDINTSQSYQKKSIKMDAQMYIDQAVDTMKTEASKQHVTGLQADIAEACYNSCGQGREVKEDCVKKCTALYISTWNTMSNAVIPELKRANGIG